MLFSVIASVFSVEAADTIGRARRSAVAYLVAAVLAITGIGFLVGAGYIATARRLGELEAALAFGGGFLVVAVLLLIVQRLTAAAARRRAVERRRREMSQVAAAATVGFLGSKGSVLSTLAATVLAGLLLGLFTGKRRDD
jgi:hypothetical protein